MAEHYPELSFGADAVTGCEAFEGVLPLVAAKSGVVRGILVRIIFPVGYPDDEPRAFDHTDRFLPHAAMRHFYSADGRCCLWLPWDSQWQPGRHDGLLDFMAHLSIFFTTNSSSMSAASGLFQPEVTGERYREFLSETLGISHQEFPRFVPLLVDGARVAYLPCPCGSGEAGEALPPGGGQ